VVKVEQINKTGNKCGKTAGTREHMQFLKGKGNKDPSPIGKTLPEV